MIFWSNSGLLNRQYSVQTTYNVHVWCPLQKGTTMYKGKKWKKLAVSISKYITWAASRAFDVQHKNMIHNIISCQESLMAAMSDWCARKSEVIKTTRSKVWLLDGIMLWCWRFLFGRDPLEDMFTNTYKEGIGNWRQQKAKSCANNDGSFRLGEKLRGQLPQIMREVASETFPRVIDTSGGRSEVCSTMV